MSRTVSDAINQYHNDYVKTKAPLASPNLTGVPTAPTPDNDTDSNQVATTEFCQNLIRRLVGAAPETLNTLVELAVAINNDPNFAETVVQALDNKLNKTDAAATYMAKTDMPITVEESQTTIEHELTITAIGPRPSKIALTKAGRTQLDGNNIEGYAENMVEFAAGNRICLSKSYNQFFLLDNDMFLLQHGENQIWSTSSGISIATKSGGGLHVNGTKIA